MASTSYPLLRPSRLPLIAAVPCLFLLVAGCGGGDDRPELPAAKLQQALDDTVRESGVPGAAAAVYVRGARWSGASGYADTSARRPMTPADQMNIASVTKTLTAILVMKQVDRGVLRLEQTLAELLPEAVIPNADRITLHMLLSQTAGVFDYSNDSPGFAEAVVLDPFKDWAAAEIYPWIASGPAGEPGAAFRYSNGNYYLLGPILERAAGRTVDELFVRDVAGPLALSRSALRRTGNLQEPFAHLYFYNPFTQTVEDR